MKLSAIIIAKNEEQSIARCIASLHFADEILVIDGESNDKTVAVAKAAGATVITNPWQGYGQQKNFGMQHAKGEWVLFIDADEAVPESLQQQILAATQQSATHFFWLRIATVFLGRPLRHLHGHNLRLFKKDHGRWTESYVHEQVEDTTGKQLTLRDSNTTILAGPLLHYSHPTVASYLLTMHQYTSLEAQQMAKTNQHRSGRPVRRSWFLPLYLGARQLVKLLFYRKGILDGVPGITWCVLSAYYEWELGIKFVRLASK